VYAIVLAGGYAKRLWPLTLNTPKALLPVAGKPILDYVMDKLEAFNPPLKKIVLSTNQRFQPQFKAWLASKAYGNVVVLPDDSESEVQKPGAIKAMANITAFADEDDVFVIAGDGMFKDDLSDMMEAFSEKKAAVVSLYEVRSLQEAKRCATVKVDPDGKILEFAEKPAQPKTTMVCGAVYAFPKTVKKRLAEYLAEELPADQPGRFVEWLCKKEPVYGYMLKDYLWDIGTREAYKECNQHFFRSQCHRVVRQLWKPLLF
jgi:glucose-1-phosphate thymidylyltransferase